MANTWEDKLQIACAQRLNYLQKTLNFVWYHVPNGGNRDAITGAKMKMMGARKGVADIVINWFPGKVGYIELKLDNTVQHKKTYLRKTQKEFRDEVEALGIPYEVARSHDEVTDLVKKWLQS